MDRRYGIVHCAFWSSQTIRGLSDDGKLLAIYLLTCPHASILGCYRLPAGYVVEDTGWSIDRVKNTMLELGSSGFAIWEEASQWVFLPRWFCWAQKMSGTQRVAVYRAWFNVPTRSSIRPLLAAALLDAGFDQPDIQQAADTPSMPHRCPIDGVFDDHGWGIQRPIMPSVPVPASDPVPDQVPDQGSESRPRDPHESPPGSGSAGNGAPKGPAKPSKPAPKQTSIEWPDDWPGHALVEEWFAQHPSWRDSTPHDRERVRPAFVKAVDAILRIDSRTPEQVREVLDFICDDEPRGDWRGWASVCQSPEKLRKISKAQGVTTWQVISSQMHSRRETVRARIGNIPDLMGKGKE